MTREPSPRSSEGISIRDLIGIAFRHRLAIAASLVVCLAASTLVAWKSQPSYEATITAELTYPGELSAPAILRAGTRANVSVVENAGHVIVTGVASSADAAQSTVRNAMAALEQAEILNDVARGRTEERLASVQQHLDYLGAWMSAVRASPPTNAEEVSAIVEAMDQYDRLSIESARLTDQLTADFLVSGSSRETITSQVPPLRSFLLFGLLAGLCVATLLVICLEHRARQKR